MLRPSKLLALICIALPLHCTNAESYRIQTDRAIPQVEFASSKVQDALLAKGHSVESDGKHAIVFELTEGDGAIGEFSIRTLEKQTTIRSVNPNGLMYGGLELAEQMSLYGEFRDAAHSPFIEKRGIKMNMPLDVRTPSYDDTGDAAQQNIAEMWTWEFWEEYLDTLALHRYNVLTLWNPHPFPSMIKQEKFPEVALDDVKVTTLKPTGIEHEWAEPQMVSSNIVEHSKTVKKITIDEKIAFWKKVMQRASDRGIDIYFFTWNLCANGAAKPVPPFYRTYRIELWDEEPSASGISNQMDNKTTMAYYRDAVKTFLLTYPNVKGIGVTAGEHMMDEAGDVSREQWIWETYGLGILDAKKQNPNLSVDFIHRVWNTKMDKIMKYWDEYPDSFEASFKYAKARLYSTPTPPFAKKHIESMKPYGLKSWWNLRNDDIFVHRWGDPDYVRSFLDNFDKEYTAGFYMGSDGYVWGREFIDKRPELSGQLEVEKHWYKFMLWGRLAYQNDLDSDFFQAKLKERFPETDGTKLYSSWQSASKIIPLVNRFHWRDWDYQWAVEACFNMRDGFHTVNDFIDNPTLAKSGILNPRAYAKSQLAKEEITGQTPMEVIHELRSLADQTLDTTTSLRTPINTASLDATLDDMENMAALGQYYADKIEAATLLAFYQETGSEHYKTKAIHHLKDAFESWTEYAERSETNYQPQTLARTRRLDWAEISKSVQADIDIAAKLPKLTAPQSKVTN